MRILVTGATGLVGRHVVRCLAAVEGVRVVSFDLPSKRARRLMARFGNVEPAWGDLRDEGAVGRVLDGVDAVVHLGAIIPPAADQHPQLAHDVNVGGTRNLLAGLAARPGVRFVYTSSISVYGDRVENPWIRFGDPVAPSIGDEYARTKIEAEEAIRNSTTNWTICRLTFIIDPKKDIDPLMFHMPLSTGIEILHAQDVGALLAKIVRDHSASGLTFNLGAGEVGRTNYRTFLRTVFSIHGFGEKFLPEYSFAQRNFHCGYYADSHLALDRYGYRPLGLEEYYAALRKRIPRWKRALFGVMRHSVRRRLLRSSEPWQAILRDNAAALRRFFGDVRGTVSRRS